jgi:hypothetical protein
MLCNGFELNLVRFDFYEDLMCDLCVTGKIHSLILHSVAHLTLHPTPHPVRDPTLHLAHDPTLGVQEIWWLAH